MNIQAIKLTEIRQTGIQTLHAVHIARIGYKNHNK